MPTWSDRRQRPATTAVTVLLLVACGGAPEAGGGGAAAAAPALDACAILSEVDVASFLGAAPDTLMEVVGRAEGKRAVSQCVAFGEGAPGSVSLFLRYEGNSPNPTSREEWLQGEAAADILAMGAEAAGAVEAGEPVPGLGDWAVRYELLGSNLVVFWKDHYQLVAGAHEMADPQVARQAIMAIAQRALAAY